MRFSAWVARRLRSLPLVAAALIVILVAGLTATPAAAHASLVASSPPAGAAVTIAPTEVELIFSEDVTAPSIIAVTGPGGSQVAAGPTQVRNALVVQPLTSLTAAGVYKIAYRVVSADGHPVSGELTFTYAPPGSHVTAKAQASSEPTTGAAEGHGSHLIALGILVLAAVAASVIALRKDRRYDRVLTGPTPPGAGEASPGAASTEASHAAATDAPTAEPRPGNGAKKQRAR